MLKVHASSALSLNTAAAALPVLPVAGPATLSLGSMATAGMVEPPAEPGSRGGWAVFLSHTSELARYPSRQPYIQRAKDAVNAAGHRPVCMEFFPATDEPPHDYDVKRVLACDVYVGIIGSRYGSPVREQPSISYTEQEFDTATAAGIPRLLFLSDPKSEALGLPLVATQDLQFGARQEAFRQKVLASGCIAKFFTSPEHLAKLLGDALHALEKERTAGPAPSGAPARRTYSPAELDAWVAAHRQRLGEAFAGLPMVRRRAVHVPLDVEFLVDGGGKAPPAPLQPHDLAPLLADGPARVLVISGDGGAGKTSLAYAIGRWLLAGEPDGVVRLPVPLETGLAEGASVASTLQTWLAEHTDSHLDPPLVEALLSQRRLVPILDHVSELAPASRQRLLAALPPGLVIATSRSADDGWLGRAVSRILPRPIAVNQLQTFFKDYLDRLVAAGDVDDSARLRDDELEPAQAQLRRIVGEKPITALLAKLFIDDVIDNRERSLLAASVPQLMLRYVEKLDTAEPAQRQREGLVIQLALVQQALKRLALASHCRPDGPDGAPLYQPMAFGRRLALTVLQAPEPDGLELPPAQAKALLAYLLEFRLLQHPGNDTNELCFPLDPLADYLAALAQLEDLEGVPWEPWLAALERRKAAAADLEGARDFLLALRDGAQERHARVPADAPDRLARLADLDPELERLRLAEQRARKWMWELLVPVASERSDASAKLAAMAAAADVPAERLAAGRVASDRLIQVLANSELPLGERNDAALVLGLIGSGEAVQALQGLAEGAEQPVALRRAALEALGLAAVRGADAPIAAVLEHHLRADALDLLITGEEGWDEHDRRLPLLQGASRGLQLAASTDLPLLGSGPGRPVPMLTLTALHEGEGLRIRTEVVARPVWKLPLPAGEQLEIVVIEGGEYPIGSPLAEAGRDWYASQRDGCKGVNVEAQRSVHLAAYGMVRHLITQAQWQAVAALPPVECQINPTPGTFPPEAQALWERFAQPGFLPVDSVSWNDCQEWLRRLNRWLQQEWLGFAGSGEPPQLALPSEDQWEAACRAGAATPFHFGEVIDACWDNFNGGYTYGLGRKGAYRKRPLPVGAHGLVNRWGLAEMHGQLSEWCGDQWDRDPVGEGWPASGHPWQGPDEGLLGTPQQAFRLLRGGSWFDEPRFCRAANRFFRRNPANFNTFFGVRPCCLLPPGSLLGS